MLTLLGAGPSSSGAPGIPEPSLTAPGSPFTAEEDGAAVSITGTSISYAGAEDLEANLATAGLTITITTPGGLSVSGGGTNSVLLTGTLADMNAALASFDVTPVAGAAGAKTIAVDVRRDGEGAAADDGEITVNVTPLAPTAAITDNRDGTADVDCTDNSSAATAYEIDYRVNAGSWTSLDSGALPFDNPQVVSGLTNGDDLDVRVRVQAGTVWSDYGTDDATIALAQPTAFSFGGSMLFATDGTELANGDLLVVVYDATNVSVKVWASTDGGASFAIRSTVWANGSSRQQAYIAYDGGTNVYVASKATTTGAYLKKSTDSGATWGSEITIYAAAGVTDPSIAWLATDHLLCAFRVVNGSNHDIAVYESTDDGETWDALSTSASTASATAGLEDIKVCEAPNGDILQAYEHEIAENDHAICKMVRSTDDGATWGSPYTVYDDANNRADNEGGDPAVMPDGVNMLFTFSTDEDDRTGTGTTPSYNKNKIKYLTSADDGATWGNKSVAWDSFSNVEALTLFNADGDRVVLATKGYWPSGSPVTELVAVVNPQNRTLADDGWYIDAGTGWFEKIGADTVLRVHGFNAQSERGYVRKDTTLADGTITVDYRSSGSVRDARVAFRYTDANNNYTVTLDSTSGNIIVYKRVAGTFTPLSTVAHGGFTANTWYELQVVLLGTSIKTYINGVLKNDFTDGTYSTGKVALGSSFAATNLSPYYKDLTIA